MKSTYTALLFIAIFWQPLAAQDLSQTIDLRAENKTMQEILTQLSADYGVDFSYLNNELPDDQLDVDFGGISLNMALSHLLEAHGLEHRAHAGKVIIKRKAAPVQQVSEPQKVEPLKEEKLLETLSEEAQPSVIEESAAVLTQVESTSEKTDIAQNEVLTLEQVVIRDTTTSEPGPAIYTRTKVPVKITYIPGEASSTEAIPTDTTLLVDKQPVKSIFHAGLLYPISTNGFEAGERINHISLHAISGYSAGVEGFELSMIANVTEGRVTGAQLAGVANVVSGPVIGAQMAGVTNYTKGSSIGLQVAGVTNVSEENHTGLQVAGVTNVAKQDAGLQAAGVVNLTNGHARFGQLAMGVNLAHKVDGPQAAGLLNLQHRGNGLQVAGFLNSTYSLNGAQVSGFMNQAQRIKGAQIAPFLNIAGRVDGVQIGLINISDSIKGTPIGFFSIVNRNGYYDLELFYAEDFQANAAIKLGAKHFHNIFAFSYEMDYKNRWAYGYGFGSQWGNRGVRLNTDLITYYVIEQEFPDGAFRDYQLNLLSKFRLLASMHLGDFGIFGGPTFNVMVSEHQDSETGAYGSDIAPTPLYEHTDTYGPNLKIWVGYNVGIRF